MSSTNNKSLLFHDELLPDIPLYKKYELLRDRPYLLLNDIRIFGPYLTNPFVPWTISEEEKIATYDPEVTKVLTWVRNKIILRMDISSYETLHVLIRIATGMLNKCNISKYIQIMFHDNMVDNLHTEKYNIILSQLPFLE